MPAINRSTCGMHGATSCMARSLCVQPAQPSLILATATRGRKGPLGTCWRVTHGLPQMSVGGDDTAELLLEPDAAAKPRSVIPPERNPPAGCRQSSPQRSPMPEL